MVTPIEVYPNKKPVQGVMHTVEIVLACNELSRTFSVRVDEAARGLNVIRIALEELTRSETFRPDKGPAVILLWDRAGNATRVKCQRRSTLKWINDMVVSAVIVEYWHPDIPQATP